jgi:ligand-binding sensor domain-containing protein/serine phosphatase RsbU (regulator of sigma subunit)
MVLSNKHKLIFILLCFFSEIFANNFDFKNYSVADGLSESTINVIHEDRNGFIYLGTENGLMMFDGIKFFNYKMNIFDDLSILGNNIISLYEDKKGYIWVGTELGLSKLDPRFKTFKRIEHNEEYDLKNVEKIIEDENGNIWIQCSSGIFRYIISENKILCISCGDFNEITSFSKIFGTQSNNVIIGSFSDIFKYDAGKDSLFSLMNENYRENIDLSFITDIVEIDDNIWIASREGLVKVPNNLTTNPVLFKFNPHKNSIVNDDIRDIDYDSTNNSLWITTKDGISRYDLLNDKFFNIKVTLFANSIIENEIENIIVAEKSNQVWFTTSNYGGINSITFIHNPEKSTLDTIFVNLQYDENDQSSIPDNNINTFIEDRAGNVWFGTANNGLSFHSAIASKFSSIKYDSENEWGLLRSKIYSIEATEKNFLWVATDYGLEYLSSDGIRYDDISKSELGVNQITDIYFGGSNILWVGSTSGLLKIDLNDHSVLRYSSKSVDENHKITNDIVYDVFHDNDGYLWISTHSGVSIISLTESKIYNCFFDDPIRFIFEDYDEDMWLSTISNGLYFIKKSDVEHLFKNEKVDLQHYSFNRKNTSGISSSKITSASQADTNTIWFGSSNGGLNKFNKINQTFEHFFVENGLPSNYITALHHSDNKTLWISSKNGITNFNLSDNRMLNYNLYDGLSDLDFFRNSVSSSKSGNIYFGGPNGLTIIRPSEIKFNSYKPPCLITRLQKSYFDGSSETVFLNKQGEANNEKITIDHRVKSISIEFAALNYHEPIKNKYRYILKDLDTKWTELDGVRFVTYNNFGRGSYIFAVQGSNNDNLWSDKTSIELSFVPHPLMSYAAFFIYFIVVFGSVYQIVVYKNKQEQHQTELKKHKKELEEARNFQLSMIPMSPPDGIQYDVVSHMKTSEEVGGDYYDYFIQDDVFFAVCGDATGHGLNAGMMVSITKAGLYGLTLDNPKESLIKLNRAIKAIDLGKMRMSLNIARFHKNKVVFSSAGMPPAYYFDSKKNETTEILIPGLPLGSIKNADYELINFEMNKNDVLVLISDGLPECSNSDGEMLDYDSVKSCVNDNGYKSSKEIVNELIEIGNNWMGEKTNEDDITIVVIKKI